MARARLDSTAIVRAEMVLHPPHAATEPESNLTISVHPVTIQMK